jgi:predicted nucleotidyltransferase component of viral defense system
MSRPATDIAASVRQRLLNKKAAGEQFQTVLARYGVERLLYRLSKSPHADSFVLKGAMLLRIWGAGLHRPTTDLDLLGLGESDIEHLEDVFRAVCEVPVEDDGLVFLADTIHGARIREDQTYQGVRLKLLAMLGVARIPVQVDIGFGDPMVPGAQDAVYPTLLDLPAPRLRTYPMESVVAEKFQAMVALGMANGRLKDFYDLWGLASREAFSGGTLSRAIQATFAARGSTLPDAVPVALTPEFHADRVKNESWAGFLNKNGLTADGRSLSEVAAILVAFLMPPVEALCGGVSFNRFWPPGGPWQEENDER